MEEANKQHRSWRTARRATVFCVTAGVLLLCAYAFWSFMNVEAPPAILPPAGEVLQGAVPFRFAVLGDTRGNMAVFEEVLARIKSDNPNLIIHTGDIAKRYTQRQFEWILHELNEADLSVPFCPVPGNHDIEAEAEEAADHYRLYERAFGPHRYWFAYANCLFVAFDSSSKKASPEDLEWLEATLARYRPAYETCVVFMHVPLHDARPGQHREIQAGKDEMVNILKKHDVTAIFAGHNHVYSQGTIGGIRIYVNDGAGERLKDGEQCHMYILCTVEDGGKLTVTRRDVPDVYNDDYPEYVFRVRFPNFIVLCTGAILLLAGTVISRHAARR